MPFVSAEQTVCRVRSALHGIVDEIREEPLAGQVLSPQTRTIKVLSSLVPIMMIIGSQRERRTQVHLVVAATVAAAFAGKADTEDWRSRGS
jgi:hypothetical protein